MVEHITYKDSGVDIDLADAFVKKIKSLVRSTFRQGVLSEIGHFGALFELDTKKFKNPVLVSSTDGVGTKLKVAFMAGKHDTVGIDLVAMCVNDILTLGAEPLFFLDYFAAGKLSLEVSEAVIKGIVDGCKQAGCALIGGETAEMPGFYPEGEYDLSGFVVGIVEKDEIIDGRNVRPGDIIIGLESSGLHSNGYSLVRRLFFEINNYKINDFIEELGTELASELLKPTVIYVKAVKVLHEKGINIKAMAHITGGGIPGNLVRVIPEGLQCVIREGSWPEHAIFSLIRRLGKVPEDEMRKTFNLGIGYTMIVAPEDVDRTVEVLKSAGYAAYAIGYVRQGQGGVVYEKIT